MVSSKILTVFLIAFFVLFKEHTCEKETELTLTMRAGADVSECQEFRTSAEIHKNFFNLDYFINEKQENETFRYKLYVQGDRNIYISLTVNDNPDLGTNCYEFGINVEKVKLYGYRQAETSISVASTLKTSIGGSEKVRTEEAVPLSRRSPMPVVIIGKNDGEVQLFVAAKQYPLLRFPNTSLHPKFISFAAGSSNGKKHTGLFYFNCGHSLNREKINTAVVIPDDHAYPVAYISFHINSLSRDSNTVTVDLQYNMTFQSDSNPNEPTPTLDIYSDHVSASRTKVDDDRITATTTEIINVRCPTKYGTTLYCDLAFGIEGRRYHLTHLPNRPMFSSSIGQVADIKVYQSDNTASISAIPLKGDITMTFKIDTEKFERMSSEGNIL